jgi:hypothetical protein
MEYRQIRIDTKKQFVASAWLAGRLISGKFHQTYSHRAFGNLVCQRQKQSDAALGNYRRRLGGSRTFHSR